jgi:hypothetical protein
MRQGPSPLRWRLLGATGLLCAFLAGCAQEPPAAEKFFPVTGKVTMGGQPLTAGSVTFHPDAAKGNNSPHVPVGFLDAQGNYTLKTGTKDGAPPGWYKVTISAQEPADGKNPYAPPKHLINPKFGGEQTSGLGAQVVENPTPNAYDFYVSK